MRETLRAEAPMRSARRSTAFWSSPYVPREKAETETVGVPPAAFSKWHEDQISSGWSGPHSCQALRTAAALDHGQDMYAETPCGAGWVLKRSSVTTPKLPLPAPRRAQKRSLFSVALAVSCFPAAVISVAWVRLSHVRP